MATPPGRGLDLQLGCEPCREACVPAPDLNRANQFHYTISTTGSVASTVLNCYSTLANSYFEVIGESTFTIPDIHINVGPGAHFSCRPNSPMRVGVSPRMNLEFWRQTDFFTEYKGFSPASNEEFDGESDQAFWVLRNTEWTLTIYSSFPVHSTAGPLQAILRCGGFTFQNGGRPLRGSWGCQAIEKRWVRLFEGDGTGGLNIGLGWGNWNPAAATHHDNGDHHIYTQVLSGSPIAPLSTNSQYRVEFYDEIADEVVVDVLKYDSEEAYYSLFLGTNKPGTGFFPTLRFAYNSIKDRASIRHPYTHLSGISSPDQPGKSFTYAYLPTFAPLDPWTPVDLIGDATTAPNAPSVTVTRIN